MKKPLHNKEIEYIYSQFSKRGDIMHETIHLVLKETTKPGE